MDVKQIAKFEESIRLLTSVEGQVGNLKKRVPEAAKDAIARHKAVVAARVDFPHWKNVAAGLAKMLKPIAAAEKAAAAIHKLYDKKKLAAMTVADLKKKIQSLMPPFKALSDDGTAFWSAMGKAEKEVGGIDDAAVALKTTHVSYNAYNEYLNHFKISLGKIV
jgi:hypothetical protein